MKFPIDKKKILAIPRVRPKKYFGQYGWFLILAICLLSCSSSDKVQHFKSQGKIFGTTYSIQYFAKEKRDYSLSYDSIFRKINQALSTYLKDSDISKINQGDTTVVVDMHFEKVFGAAKQVYQETDGMFDPTIGILVNAWNFGPTGEILNLDSLKIKKLLDQVGLYAIELQHQKIYKQKRKSYLDFNALAKGYAVDVVGNFLESQGIQHYLVEIGGEIIAKGQHRSKKKPWQIGLEDPNFDGSQSYSKVISLVDQAMATSGSYRKYKIDSLGGRYTHIIDPKTGYPIRSKLLSVSVIAPTCMLADAYATAFMAMGLDSTKEFLKNKPDIQAYFIYENRQGILQNTATSHFP